MRLARHEPVADVARGGLGKGEGTVAPIRGRYLLQELVKLKTTCPGIADVRGRGAMVGVELGRDLSDPRLPKGKASWWSNTSSVSSAHALRFSLGTVLEKCLATLIRFYHHSYM